MNRSGTRARWAVWLVVIATATLVFSEVAPAAAQDTRSEAGFESARCPTDEELAIIEDRIPVGEIAAGGSADIGSDYVYRGPACMLVEIDTDAGDQLSENFVPIRATLFRPDTGEPIPESYSVGGSIRSEGFQDDQFYSFAYPFESDPSTPPGVYRGVVIVPITGAWTVSVSAFDRVDVQESSLPTPLARGSIRLDLVVPTLQSAVDLGRIDDPPFTDWVEVFVLGLHSALGLTWFVFAGLTALIALGGRRDWLSREQNDLLDRNVGRVIQGIIWTTAFIWLTGVINLNGGSAYSPPLSPDQADDIFLLPYGKPYTITLYIKIFTYGLMTLLAIPLVRAARRRSEEWEDIEYARSRSANAEEGATLVAAPGPVKLGILPRLSIGSVVVGGVVIFVCVTALKYIHIISETVRGIL